MADLQLTCIPDKVTLTCKATLGTTTVRVRTSNNAKDKEVTALGFDPAAVSVTVKDKPNSASGKTGDGGYIDYTVGCVSDGPCPSKRIVTFDATDYSSCTLTIDCTDNKPAAG